MTDGRNPPTVPACAHSADVASDQPQALAAIPDGTPLDQWIEREGCSRSSAYKWIRELGIETTMAADPDDPRKQRAWLSTGQADQLSAYAKHRKGKRIGEVRIGDVMTVSRAPLPLVPMVPPGWAPSAETADDADTVDDEREAVELLALRLRALKDAVELGAPLSTREVRLLLGARPGGDRVTRAGIEARREARGLWRLGKVTDRRERW